MAMKTLPALRSMFKEPQLLHKWQIEVPSWPKAVTPSNPDILFFVTTSGLPKEDITDAEVELGGFKFSFNGKTNRNGEIDWTFFENIDQTISQFFLVDYPNARQNYTSSSNIDISSRNEADLIVPDILMHLYDASGTKITTTYHLVNAKFKTNDFGGELGQEATAQKPSINVQYDAFVVRPKSSS
jgi:hypothetical protein